MISQIFILHTFFLFHIRPGGVAVCGEPLAVAVAPGWCFGPASGADADAGDAGDVGDAGVEPPPRTGLHQMIGSAPDIL